MLAAPRAPACLKEFSSRHLHPAEVKDVWLMHSPPHLFPSLKRTVEEGPMLAISAEAGDGMRLRAEGAGSRLLSAEEL